MSAISSYLSAPASSVEASAAKKTPTAFEINSAQFGPAAATAIGLTAAATDVMATAASATYSFSSDGLKKLSDLVGDAAQGVEGAVTGLGDELSSIGRDAEAEVKKAYGAVSDSVSSVASAVGEAASFVKDEVVSAADAAGQLLAGGISALA
jgi:hypothetical protein